MLPRGLPVTNRLPHQFARVRRRREECAREEEQLTAHAHTDARPSPCSPLACTLTDETFEYRTSTDDSLCPLRSSRNAADLDPGLLFEKVQIILGLGRQIFIRRNAEGRGSPPGHALVDRLDLLDLGHTRRHAVADLLPETVTGAYLNLVEFVKHVELGHHQAVEAVDGGGVAQQRNVEPAAAPRTSGDGPEFVPALADAVARAVQRLGRERTGSHARDVRLGDADDALNPRRRHAGASACSARAGA